MTPQPVALVGQYRVTCVPPGSVPDWHVWCIYVDLRRDGRWLVSDGGSNCYGGGAMHEREPSCFNEHLYDVHTALDFAKKAAPGSGITAQAIAQIVARLAAREGREAPRVPTPFVYVTETHMTEPHTEVFFVQYLANGEPDKEPPYTLPVLRLERLPVVGDRIALPGIVNYPVEFYVFSRGWYITVDDTGAVKQRLCLGVVQVDHHEPDPVVGTPNA